jgi:hypothetical protein
VEPPAARDGADRRPDRRPPAKCARGLPSLRRAGGRARAPGRGGPAGGGAGGAGEATTKPISSPRVPKAPTAGRTCAS